ncbi:MAG: helix-turn-helix transcriptional regulator [Edaphobacter sp.]|uniref:helix-turn-helix transcriptional regulator n=1 Tax=Edaphobacter sp. TaxID=1934404 RepID=UPI002395DEAC|nr:helix-turn-helix transcriptional regulator [Edaphobacter sp.]MDE1177545.1 helix-turn-helix transcriptional regulator [Edaphobacter sp.]
MVVQDDTLSWYVFYQPEMVGPMNEEQQRAELADFLRTRRERANASEFGIIAGRRRRTPGLRREEVAQLAQVSVAWYTFLEQGRQVRASSDVLERLAQALRLDRAEREHLFLIARGHPPADKEGVGNVVDANLQMLLDAMPYPAYASMSDWTIIASNRAAQIVFHDYSMNPSGPINVLKLLFTDPVHRSILVNWKRQAQDTLAMFRASTAHSAGEAWHKKLVEELSRTSPEFRKWWPKHDVRVNHGGPKEFNHPVAGRMVFQPLTLRYEGEPTLRVVVKIPQNTADTVEKLSALLNGKGSKSFVSVFHKTKSPRKS